MRLGFERISNPKSLRVRRHLAKPHHPSITTVAAIAGCISLLASSELRLVRLRASCSLCYTSTIFTTTPEPSIRKSPSKANLARHTIHRSSVSVEIMVNLLVGPSTSL